MSEVFGQQFVVENRVGGNGTIAAETVTHAQPDGYTLFWAGAGGGVDLPGNHQGRL